MSKKRKVTSADYRIDGLTTLGLAEPIRSRSLAELGTTAD